MQAYVLGIDIGTGSTKAVAVNRKGSILDATQAFYPAGTSHSEQDPHMIWKAFVQCMQQVMQQLPYPPVAISLSSAMHSVMQVNAAGIPLSPLITWADDRAANLASDLLAQPLGKELYEQCGTPIHALSPLCKIAWWRTHAPAKHEKTYKFIGIKEWIWYQLFGLFEIDYSLASATGMLHLNTLQWYPPALEYAGITTAQLSTPVATTWQRSGMKEGAAAQLGLPVDIPVIIGASDGCLANLGTAALEPGVAAVTIGTSAAVRMASYLPRPRFPEQLFNYNLDTRLWITGGAINNGGAAVAWAARHLFEQGLDDTALAVIENIPAGSDGLLFLPYLLGERAPIWDSNSSAAYIGLREYHDKGHLLKAVIEGVCLALRAVLSPLGKAAGKIERLHLSGGFSRSAAAMQVLADCTGKKIVRLQTEDASAIGAAFLSFKAIGWISDFTELPQTTFHESFEPNLNNLPVYDHLFDLYQQLYPQLQHTMHQLRELGRKE